MPTDQCRVVVAHHRDDQRTILTTLVETLGHKVAAAVADHPGLVKEGVRPETEVVITSVKLENGDGIEALLDIARVRPVPAIVVAAPDEMDRVEQALEDHVMAYLVEPFNQDDLRPTLYLVRRRFAQFQELRKEVETLREALSTRKLVDRAKGKLMDQHGLSEDEAYTRLRKKASERRVKIREIAEAILLAEEMGDDA